MELDEAAARASHAQQPLWPPQPQDSLKPRPSFQMLHDPRAAPLQEEDTFRKGHGTSWLVLSLPPPAIKSVFGHLQLPPESWQCQADPTRHWDSPDIPAYWDRGGPTRAGASGSAHTKIASPVASEAVQTQTRVSGTHRPKAVGQTSPGIHQSWIHSSSIRLL